MGRTPREDAPQPGPHIQGVVCVVDGDVGIRDGLHMLLASFGVPSVPFSTAEEFLRGWSGDDRVLLLITELKLPGRSGLDLKKALNDRGVCIPVIGIANEVTPGNRAEAVRLGFADLIEKPFVGHGIVAWVQRHLNASSERPSPDVPPPQ